MRYINLHLTFDILTFDYLVFRRFPSVLSAFLVECHQRRVGTELESLRVLAWPNETVS